MGSAVAAVFPYQGPGESLRGVWKHRPASEEGGRLPQQRHVVPVLGECAQQGAPAQAAYAALLLHHALCVCRSDPGVFTHLLILATSIHFKLARSISSKERSFCVDLAPPGPARPMLVLMLLCLPVWER